MATLQNFDDEIAKTEKVVKEMRSKIEQSGNLARTRLPPPTKRSARPISTSRMPASRT